MPDNPKTKQLQGILTLLTESVSKDEFLQATEALIKIVKDIKKGNETEWALVSAAFQLLEKRLVDSNTTNLTAFKQETSALITTSLASARDAIDARLTSLKDGLDGERGQDADPLAIKEAVLGHIIPLLPVPIKPLAAEDVRNHIESLSGDERLDASAIKGLPEATQQIAKNIPGWGAHPLAIQSSGAIKTKLAHTLNFTGATVTQSADGVTTVAVTGSGGGGGTLTSEMPVGTIDGVNTVFTVSNATVQLFLNGALQQAGGGDYTLSGLTITYVNAPVVGSIHTSWYFSSVAQGTPKGEAPSGTINSSNKIFTLSQTPSPAAFLQLYLGRQLQIQGVDYTLSSATITYTTAPDISLVGQHYAYYTY